MTYLPDRSWPHCVITLRLIQVNTCGETCVSISRLGWANGITTLFFYVFWTPGFLCWGSTVLCWSICLVCIVRECCSCMFDKMVIWRSNAGTEPVELFLSFYLYTLHESMQNWKKILLRTWRDPLPSSSYGVISKVRDGSDVSTVKQNWLAMYSTCISTVELSSCRNVGILHLSTM